MPIVPQPIVKKPKFWPLVLLTFFAYNQVIAQSLLNRHITINASQNRLSDVLTEIGNKGDFYFSYNGKLIPKDSLVTLVADNQSVYVVLSKLFNHKYEFEEIKNYVIILPVLQHLSLVNTDLITDNNSYSISGFVINEHTGERLTNVSVYEKERLVAVLTDEHGYFRLKFKIGNTNPIVITASKIQYKDTSVNFLQTVSVTSRTENVSVGAAYSGNQVERTRLGRLFISTRQMIQSMNIPDFFAKRPFQISLTPGLSTHGIFSPQVVNKFSINLIGGYTAGVNGLEAGGLFNINKKDSKYVQLAGIFNLTGGNVVGLQVAGVNNSALDTVKGAQLALFTNNAGKQLSGLQVSALHNETCRLKGVQIGLVNVADTSFGASIGLINVIGNGFYKITYFANGLSNMNISLKTGTHEFYSELLTSVNISPHQKFYSFGLGGGHDFIFSRMVYLSAAANYQFANTGNWDDRLMQEKLLLNIQLSKNISMVAGPAFNHYTHSGMQDINGYKNVVGNAASVSSDNGHRSRNWIGWEAGIAFNSVFKTAKKAPDDSGAWYLYFSATGGIGWDQPYGLVSGGELSVQRGLGGYLTGTLSSGYTYFSIDRNYLQETYGGMDTYFRPIKIIPVKAGIRLAANKMLFVTGELGEAFGKEQAKFYAGNYTSFHSFMYAVSAGFSFKNGIETSLKFEDYSLQSQYKQFALKLGYRLKINK